MSSIQPVTKAPKTTPFQEKVYELLKQIPAGRVTTYAHLSHALNSSPRAVGGALKRNPYAPKVPCHRVIAKTGYIGGFFGEWKRGPGKGAGPEGEMVKKKLRILEQEGVSFDETGRIRDMRRVWSGFKVPK